jgi:hypothetical protein
MKTSIRLICVSLIILSVAGLSSCNKDAGNTGIGTIEFSLNLPAGFSQLKSANIDSGIVSYQLMISVEDENGNAVLSDKLIPLYTFGTSFVSAKVEIKTGEFRLTRFMVLNPSGAIIYASPVAGSPLAYLINKPLPMPFTILPDKNTPLIPEVLVVGDQAPSQFGYATFSVQIIKPLDFYTMCVLGYANPMIMAPIQITTAKLTISNNNGWIYSFNLTATVNHLIIRGGSENYTFLLEKEGYASQKMQFSGQQLLSTTKENPLVLQILNGTTVTQMFFLRPGPEKGKDAMISNLEPDKNFGAHKYFEATYMTEPILTVMRSNRSLLFFDLSTLPKPSIIKKVALKLFYDVPIPWDSTIFISSNSTTPLKVGGVIQQVIEPWEENVVTWNNQPKTTELNQVFIPPFIRNVNFIEVDITGLILTPATNLLPNHGMLFKLYSNERFKGFRFASSDYPDSLMRPKLSIQYSTGN